MPSAVALIRAAVRSLPGVSCALRSQDAQRSVYTIAGETMALVVRHSRRGPTVFVERGGGMVEFDQWAKRIGTPPRGVQTPRAGAGLKGDDALLYAIERCSALYFQNDFAGAAEEAALISKLILEGNAHVGTVNSYGTNALMVVARAGTEEQVRALTPFVDVRDTNNAGWTALHFAARRSQGHGACRALIRAGAEIDALDADDKSPLYFAADLGVADTCFLLMHAGAAVTPLDRPSPMTAARRHPAVLQVLSCVLGNKRGHEKNSVSRRSRLRSVIDAIRLGNVEP